MMNQLQNLLHDSLIATGHVQQCALIKRKDATIKASSVGFTVKDPKDTVDPSCPICLLCVRLTMVRLDR